MKHILDEWNSMAPLIAGKHLMLFLDFDGTLAPIAPTPAEASLSRETRDLLGILAAGNGCSIVIVSGRSLEDIREKIGIDGIVYVGNHGLESAGSNMLPVYKPSATVRDLLELVREDLAWRLKDIPGVLFEDKRASVAVHYRLVEPGQEAAVESAVRAAVPAKDVDGLLEVAPGKKVLEVRQQIGWNKGTAVAWLLHAEERRRPGVVYPIYVGDDVTDEDGFRAVERMGIGVLVGTPRKTRASHYVRDHGEVIRFLRLVAETHGGPFDR